jgi:hypothetical protein
VVKHADAVELRVVVAAVLAVADDAVLVVQRLLKFGAHVVTALAHLRVRNLARRNRQHLLKLGAHLATALARLHVHNLARRSSLEAGRTRENTGGEERRNVRNSVWQFGTGNRKCRWHTRVYPERERIKWFCHSIFLSYGHRTKGALCGQVWSRNMCFGHVLVAVRQRQRRDAVATGEKRLGSAWRHF